MMKQKYAALRIKNDDPEIYRIYNKFGLKFDGYFIRRQKIGICFDDF